jgi:hypothetical protein
MKVAYVTNSYNGHYKGFYMFLRRHYFITATVFAVLKIESCEVPR